MIIIFKLMYVDCVLGVRVELLCFLFPYMRYSDRQARHPVPAPDEPSKWPQFCFLKLF